MKRLFGLIIFSLFFTNVYAQLENSAWPMFRRDLLHTGRSPYTGPNYPVLKWSYTTGGTIGYSSPAIGSDGTVYVGSYDNKLYAIDSTGLLKWSYATGGDIYSSPAIGSDGTVYFGSRDYKFYAIDSSGSLKWSYATGGEIYPSPAIGPDGTVYFGSDDNKLYALDSTGSLKWSYATKNFIYSSPAIGPDGTVYVGSSNSKLYALDSTGLLKWSYTTGNLIAMSSPAIGSDGRTVYVGSYDNKLYALDSTGSLKWSYTTGNHIYSSPAIGSDGTVYVGSYDNKLYAIDSTGSLKWSYTTGDHIYSSPAIGSDGTIYFGSDDKKLYAIDSTGLLKWSYTTKREIYSSPAIGSDGTVYFGSYDGKLYAIGPDTVPPSAPAGLTANGSNPSPWQDSIKFSIDWTNPSDVSGIAGSWCKLDSAPSYSSDGFFVTEKPFDMYVDTFIKKPRVLYVWLQDSSGNKNYLNNASVMLRYDAISPAAPESLLANGSNPSPWTTDSIFTIRYVEADSQTKSINTKTKNQNSSMNSKLSSQQKGKGDTSGISLVLYKLGTCPSSNYDTTGTANINPFNVECTVQNGETLWVWLKDYVGNLSYNNRAYVILNYHTVGIEDKDIPDRFVLFSPTPNPSMKSITIKYGLPDKAEVSLVIYDISGRLVKTLSSEVQEKGYHTVNIREDEFAKGIYFVKFKAGECRTTKKLVLMK